VCCYRSPKSVVSITQHSVLWFALNYARHALNIQFIIKGFKHDIEVYFETLDSQLCTNRVECNVTECKELRAVFDSLILVEKVFYLHGFELRWSVRKRICEYTN